MGSCFFSSAGKRIPYNAISLWQVAFSLLLVCIVYLFWYEAELILLDSKIQRTKRKDFNNFKNMAIDLIKEKDKKVKLDEKENID